MNAENTKSLLNRYPKIFRQAGLPMTQTAMCWLFECGDGWYWLIDNLCNFIQTAIDNNIKYNPEKWSQVEASQVKEKYGGLRFYVYGGNDEIAGAVWLAENLSYKICEDCGSTENVTQSTGWIYTRCQKCHDKMKEEK